MYIWTLLPQRAFTLSTPTIPKLYWEVKSQEQRWLMLCEELNKLVKYADILCENVNFNHEEIEALKAQFQKFVDSGFFDYYADQLEAWINENMEWIISQAIKMVFFGLTPDGYFCAYIPKSWAGIVFDTGADYSKDDYGCLILKY